MMRSAVSVNVLAIYCMGANSQIKSNINIERMSAFDSCGAYCLYNVIFAADLLAMHNIFVNQFIRYDSMKV